MKSYIYNLRTGDMFKIRFYKTGGVTLVDKNGEHEIGMWKKKNGEEYGYYSKLYESKHNHFSFKQEDIADSLLREYLWNIKYWYNNDNKK